MPPGGGTDESDTGQAEDGGLAGDATAPSGG